MIPYIVLIIVTLIVSKWAEKSNKAYLFMFCFMTLFVGLRDNVGTDYASYTDIFDSYTFYLEPGFQLLVELLHKYGCSHVYMFFLMAMLTYGFMYFALYMNKQLKSRVSFILFTLLSLSFICNGVRQALAISIALFASCFIGQRKWYFYFPLIAAASMFHTSILVFLPLYFFCHKAAPRNLYVIIYIVSFIFASFNLEELTKPIMFLLEDKDRYLNYVEGRGTDEGYFSLGVLGSVINLGICLYLSLRYEVEKEHPVAFNLFFFSVVFLNMRIGAPIFVRVQTMFSWYMYWILPISISKIKNYTNKQLISVFYLMSLSSLTIKYIFFDDTSFMYPYKFVFSLF